MRSRTGASGEKPLEDEGSGLCCWRGYRTRGVIGWAGIGGASAMAAEEAGAEGFSGHRLASCDTRLAIGGSRRRF